LTDNASLEIDVVRSFLKALEAKDLDLALSYLDAEVEYQNMPLPPTRSPRRVRRILAPLMRATAFEARIDKIAANDFGAVLTERTDAVLLGPVRIPFHVCGTFEVRQGKITVWRETFDYTSAVVNTVLAGPLYLLRRVSMSIALRAAARKDRSTRQLA
jgi:limonene-1,2-epoxide hydrolase